MHAPGPLVVVVTATFTVDPLGELLGWWGRVVGAEWRVQLSGYNQVMGELLDGASGTRRNDGLNVLMIRPADFLRERSATGAESGEVVSVAREMADALAVAVAGSRARWLVVVTPRALEPTADEVAAWEIFGKVAAAVGPAGRMRVVAGWDVARAYRVASVFDADGDRLGHLPHPAEYLAALAAVVAREAHERVARPVKVVAVDADQTLWRGVVGEVGVDGVVVDAPCRVLQDRLRGLRERGVLLALVTKNEPADVEAVLREHAGMRLRRDDFVAVRAGWQAKSRTLRELAAELDLGLDSFVFLDDNPVEVAEVRAHAPEVVALQVPAEAVAVDGVDSERAMRDFLDHVWAFDGTATATAEDAARTEMYRAQADRAGARRQAPSFDSFLESLQLAVEIVPATPADVPRLAQLTQRTNQFNAVGRRRDEAELAQDVKTGLTALTVSARDRFGDYGLVGLIGFRMDGLVLKVEHFLLSCRALGKRIEHRMIEALQAEAARCQATAIHLPLHRTERNEPVASFLESHFAAHFEEGIFRLPPGAVCRQETAGAPEMADDIAPAFSSTDSPTLARPLRIPSDLWQRVATKLATGHGVLTARGATSHRARPPDFAIAFRETTGPLESSVAGRIEEILALSPVGADDNFFELGGQSVQAAQVLARLSLDHGHRIPLRALFDHPTPAALAAYLASLGPSTSRILRAVPRDQTAYPLSAAQRRMWFLDRYAPGHAAYHIVSAHRLTGPIDIDALRRALESLARRHECLRARFPDIDGHPTQVFDGPGIQLVVHDDPADAAATPAMVRLDEVLVAPRVALDIASGPLARLDLTRHPDGTALAVLTIHHIVADGWSLGVLYRDLGALVAGRPINPLAFQPLDLAAHQEARFAEGGFATDLAFWRQALHQPPEALNLPTDFPRPAERTFEGAVAVATLPAELTAALDRLARTQGATLFAALMAGFHALLHRWSGQDDILVGTPVSGRGEATAEDVIGCLINTVVIRSRPEATQSFAGLLTAIRDTSLAAFSHQDLPFERLIEALEVPRSRAVSPLFQVMLVLQNTPAAPLALPGGASTRRAVHNGTAKFDLVLEITPYPDGAHTLTLEYNTALFRPQSAAQLLSSFVTLLGHAARAPATALATLDLITPSERSHLVDDFNPHRSFSPAAPTIHHWFEATAARFPERTAVTCADESLTYGALNRRANQVAHRLRATGVAPGTPVAVCLERSLDLVVALLGILKSGAAYLPIDLSYPADRLSFMIEDAAAAVFLTQRHLAEKLPPHRALVLCLDDPTAGIESQPTGNPPAAATADDLIYIIYTSGSTGTPKGCCLTHGNVTRLFSATEAWFHFDERDVWTLFHSYGFDFSVWELWGALLYGGRLVVVPFLMSRSPDDFHALLVREQVTVLNQTPSAFRQVIAVDGAAGPPSSPATRLALRLVIFGGEALEMQCLRPWFDRHGDACPQLVNMYGITETTVHVTYRPLRSCDVAGGSVIGIPIPDLRLYILDPHRQPCPIGVPGELFVGGAGVARGYLHRDELTAQRFIPSPFVAGDRLYRTGDLARFLPDRDVEYLGRIDRQVKIRGFRIELGEIESALLTHPAVREAAVLARDGLSGRQLVAYVVPSPTPTASPSPAFIIDDLRAHLRRTLPDSMVPAAWVVVPSFPLTPNGKLDTAALPLPENEGAPATATEAPATETPATATEQALAEMWRTVLRLNHVGRHDNFFSVGGDSILSIQVISLARRAGWPLAPRHLFEHQTLATLAACADTLGPATSATTVRASGASASGDVPLTPIQRWFVAQPLDDPHWWNQAFLLELRRPIDETSLRTALTAVLARHDAFRLRTFRASTDSGATVSQWYAEAPGDAWIEIVGTKSALPAAMERAHRALNMETGPLVGAVLAPDRFFLAIHHMVIDGVSWRIVLEDLEAALSGRVGIPATDSFQAWSHALVNQTTAFEADRSFWEKFLEPHPLALPPDGLPTGEEAADTIHTIESSVAVAVAELTADETTALLTLLPPRTRARIDEILLTAVALALRDVGRQSSIRFHTEGHGREEAIEGVDVTRTVGWFTALYPVQIDLPADAGAADALRAIKDRFRAIPGRGLGWGVLGVADRAATTPDVVFNYLGQIDALVAGSSIFRLASDPTPPWHGPSNRRPHAVEIDAFVRDGRLRTEFRLSRTTHRDATRAALANTFAARVRELLGVEVALAPSDFPLVRLPAAQVSALGPVDDVWPLSPMQHLLATAAAVKGGAALDQWSCRLRGPLDVPALQRAWGQVLARHAMVRAILHAPTADSLVALIPSPDRGPAATWQIDDWRTRPADGHAHALRALRLDDQRHRPDPTAAPLLRFTLVRLAEEEYFFLWSTPDWMLDGWSWPIVFRELAAFYTDPAAALPPARPYRDYLAWLARCDSHGDEPFWRQTLDGFRSPTPLPVEKPLAPTGHRTETSRLVPSRMWDAVTARARAHGLTPNALLMAAWAALLARSSGRDDIVFGAAFSGRPADLPGVEDMVGPCTTNLPIRVRVAPYQSLAALGTSVRDAVFAASSHQFVSPLQVQDWSAVPWRDRLFDSLVVFQNYEVSEAARSLGERVRIDDFDGPVHGSYTLTLVATPQTDGLHLLMAHGAGRCSSTRAADILASLVTLLQGDLDAAPTLEASAAWPAPPSSPASAASAAPTRIAPRTPLEVSIHRIWARAFGPEVGVEENFFDAGGHSLLAYRVLAALRAELGLAATPADLFQFPTIAALARRFDNEAPPAVRPTVDPATTPSPTALDALKARAARARRALGQR